MSEELPHIRCYTCNKILADKWKTYEQMLEKGERIQVALNKLGLTRPCCRMRLMNPFKTVERDPQVQSDVDKMACAMDMQVPSGGALSALSSVTMMTIVPEEESEISLPPLPEIPSLPSVGARQEISRTYQAW